MLISEPLHRLEGSVTVQCLVVLAFQNEKQEFPLLFFCDTNTLIPELMLTWCICAEKWLTNRKWVLWCCLISSCTVWNTTYASPSTQPTRLLFQQESRLSDCQDARWWRDVTPSCFYLFQMVFGLDLTTKQIDEKRFCVQRTVLVWTLFLWKPLHLEM